MTSSRFRVRPASVAALCLAAALAGACSGSGLSRAEARPLVALSLSGNTDLHLAAFTGTFCESDEGRRLRVQGGASVPSNAYAFGRMAGDAVMKTLVAAGYVTVTHDTLAPDAAEASHPACGTRDVCDGCPVVSKYYLDTYQLTAKGKDLFLVTPATEGEFTALYNTDTGGGPFDDVQQAFADDMPMRISLVVATKDFDVTRVSTDTAASSATVEYEWFWKPAPHVDKALRGLIPSGRNRATVLVKNTEDGWHLERDAVNQSQ